MQNKSDMVDIHELNKFYNGKKKTKKKNRKSKIPAPFRALLAFWLFCFIGGALLGLVFKVVAFLFKSLFFFF